MTAQTASTTPNGHAPTSQPYPDEAAQARAKTRIHHVDRGSSAYEIIMMVTAQAPNAVRVSMPHCMGQASESLVAIGKRLAEQTELLEPCQVVLDGSGGDQLPVLDAKDSKVRIVVTEE